MRSRPVDGPVSQSTTPLSEATIRATPTRGSRKPRLKWCSRRLKACITPAVRLMCADGMTTEMASVGDEDEQDEHHGQENRLRELSRRIVQLVHVDRVDLDAGVGEKAVDDENDARQPLPRWEGVVRVERRGGGMPLQKVD